MSDRIYQDDDGNWFFRTRGNHFVGPFDTHAETQQQLNKQVRTWARRSGPVAQWPRHWQPGRLLRRSATRQS